MKHVFSKRTESMCRENDYLMSLEPNESHCNVYIRVVNQGCTVQKPIVDDNL